MKMWMSPIGTMVNRAGSSLAGTQRLSAGTMGKPESPDGDGVADACEGGSRLDPRS
jgi:hypothetical protein